MNRAICVISMTVAMPIAAAGETLPDVLESRGGPPAQQSRPLSFEASYTGEVWSLLDGGRHRGSTYLDNVDLMATADLYALLGLPHTKAFVFGLYNNGTAFSGYRVGDAMTISNIETGVRALRLFEAWVEYAGDDPRNSVKAGLYNYNSEFDSLSAPSVFFGANHGIGTDIAQSGRNGPSIFPSTSLALRLQAGLSDRVMLRAAVLDGVPGDPEHPGRTVIKLGGGDGALIAAELEYKTSDMKLITGYWRYTAKFEDRVPTALAGAPVLAHGNDGYYLRGERRLLAGAGGDTQGLWGFFRLGAARGRFNDFSSYYSAGLVYMGLPGRSEDQVGLAIGSAQASAATREAAALAGSLTNRREVAIEATYRLTLTHWMSLRPDIQYIINPGFNPALRDALAFGLRTDLSVAF